MISCVRCLSEVSFSVSAGKHTSSTHAELVAIGAALDWAVGHRDICSFPSLRLLSDSLSALTLLTKGPPLLLSSTLHRIWSLIRTLDDAGVKTHFQWVPAHCGVHGNESADVLAKSGLSLPSNTVPISHSSALCVIRSSLLRPWRSSFSTNFLQCQVPRPSPTETLLPRSVRCELSRLRSNGHSLLLPSYSFRIGKSSSPACPSCGAVTGDLSHLLFHCPLFDHLRPLIFGPDFSFLDLWFRPWGVARLLGLGVGRGLPPAPPPDPQGRAG